MYVNLPPELEMKLNELAVQSGREPEALVLDAIEDRVNDDPSYLEEVRQGIKDMEEGRLLEHEEVCEMIRKRFAK